MMQVNLGNDTMQLVRKIVQLLLNICYGEVLFLDFLSGICEFSFSD
mgnify:CR=1 FL=1